MKPEFQSRVYTSDYRDDGMDIYDHYVVSENYDVTTGLVERWRFDHSGEAAKSFSADFVWNRRRDLRGIRFSAGVLDFHPYTTVTNLSASGFSIKILNLLAESLNFRSEILFLLSNGFSSFPIVFSYSLTVPADLTFGTLQNDGNWNGIVGMLTSKEIDFR
jgi:hypothetical protein